MNQATKSRKTFEYYVDGILKNDRIILAQTITIIESSLPSDQKLASAIMDKIVVRSGNSIRIGITGSPGVGKSTFIESFGRFITDLGKKVAVLTIDPSSQRTKGSILGDKTRMPELATNPHAFIRPSSSGSTLGGVSGKTREAMLLCEASGYDIILIETVGVGQSEVTVKNMTDLFLLLMLPDAGDSLQGIKKGIMEMADLVVVTKADGDNMATAKRAQSEFMHAVNISHSHASAWTPKVLTVSAMQNDGLIEIFAAINEFIQAKKSNGQFDRQRAGQSISYMHENFHQLLSDEIQRSDFLREKTKELESNVASKVVSPAEAGKKLLDLYRDYLAGRIS